MSSSSTSKLGLFKATAGTGEPFRTSDLNSNWDKLDADSVSVDSRLDAVEANNWVVTTRIADSNVTAAKLAATLDLTGKTVSVAAPSADAHAATKKFVDDSLAPATGAWSVVASPVTTGLVSGKFTSALRYQTVGKTVRFSCRIDLTAATPVNGSIGVQLPVAGALGVLNLNAVASNGSSGIYPLIGVKATVGGATGFQLYGAGVGTYVLGVATSSTVPVTWASGYWIEVSGTYEIA